LLSLKIYWRNFIFINIFYISPPPTLDLIFFNPQIYCPQHQIKVYSTSSSNWISSTYGFNSPDSTFPPIYPYYFYKNHLLLTFSLKQQLSYINNSLTFLPIHTLSKPEICMYLYYQHYHLFPHTWISNTFFQPHLQYLNYYPIILKSLPIRYYIQRIYQKTHTKYFYSLTNQYILNNIEFWTHKNCVLNIIKIQLLDWWLQKWYNHQLQNLRSMSRPIHSIINKNLSLKVLILGFFYKNVKVICQWIVYTLLKLSINLHKRFWSFLQQFILQNKYYLTNLCLLQGCWLQLKGKIGRSGNVRKKKLLVKWGRRKLKSSSNYLCFTSHIIITTTGVLNVSLWLMYWLMVFSPKFLNVIFTRTPKFWFIIYQNWFFSATPLYYTLEKDKITDYFNIYINNLQKRTKYNISIIIHKKNPLKSYSNIDQFIPQLIWNNITPPLSLFDYWNNIPYFWSCQLQLLNNIIYLHKKKLNYLFFVLQLKITLICSNKLNAR